MKALCVIAVVLSLASLCQSVSLACPNLMKPVEKSPDVSNFACSILRFFLNSSMSAFVVCLFPDLCFRMFYATAPQGHDE